jgi:uncharacterized protein YdeI (BOF family)
MSKLLFAIATVVLISPVALATEQPQTQEQAPKQEPGKQDVDGQKPVEQTTGGQTKPGEAGGQNPESNPSH